MGKAREPFSLAVKLSIGAANQQGPSKSHFGFGLIDISKAAWFCEEDKQQIMSAIAGKEGDVNVFIYKLVIDALSEEIEALQNHKETPEEAAYRHKMTHTRGYVPSAP